MKIYISHSTHFDFKNLLYEPLKHSSMTAHHEFIFPHEQTDALYDSKTLFENHECDMVFAEVSFPSTSQGIELGWANAQHLPIVAFHKSTAEISNSLQKLCKKIVIYEDTIEAAIDGLKEAIEPL